MDARAGAQGSNNVVVVCWQITVHLGDDSSLLKGLPKLTARANIVITPTPGYWDKARSEFCTDVKNQEVLAPITITPRNSEALKAAGIGAGSARQMQSA